MEDLQIEKDIEEFDIDDILDYQNIKNSIILSEIINNPYLDNVKDVHSIFKLG